MPNSRRSGFGNSIRIKIGSNSRLPHSREKLLGAISAEDFIEKEESDRRDSIMRKVLEAFHTCEAHVCQIQIPSDRDT